MRLWNGSNLGAWLRNLWDDIECESRPRSPEDVAKAVSDEQDREAREAAAQSEDEARGRGDS